MTYYGFNNSEDCDLKLQFTKAKIIHKSNLVEQCSPSHPGEMKCYKKQNYVAPVKINCSDKPKFLSWQN